MAARARQAQYLGSGLARGLLEICGAASRRRRKARIVYPKREQLFCTAGKGKIDPGGLERGQSSAGARAQADARRDREGSADAPRNKDFAHALRRCASRYLSRGADPAAPPIDASLNPAANHLNIPADEAPERQVRAFLRPGTDEWLRFRHRRWPGTRRRFRG